MDDPPLQSGGGGLGAIVDLEFGQDMADVQLDSDLGDGEV
jgi:hypothetical protein